MSLNNHVEPFSFPPLDFISKVQCPICRKLRKPKELLAFQNSYNGGDETLYGWAIVTNCCNAIVCKGGSFDYNRLFGGESEEALAKLGYRKVSGKIVSDKPETISARITHPPRSKATIAYVIETQK